MRDRELLVLRHAKSAWDTDAATDIERPLARRGRKACRRIAAWLRENGLLPDLVVSSPAKRARQTARRVLEAAGGDPETIVWDKTIYGGGITDLRAILAQANPTFRRVMVVGHNPAFEMFVEWLHGDGMEALDGKKPFPTAALAWFGMPEDWRELDEGDGDLVWVIRPRDLK